MNASSEVAALRKRGQLEEALALAREAFQGAPDDRYL